MLLHAIITKYRSCEGTELDLASSLIALVGRNGAGKTNILRAISRAAENARAPEGQPTLFQLLERSNIALTFSVADAVFCYTVQRGFEGAPGAEVVSHFTETLQKAGQGRDVQLITRYDESVKSDIRKDAIQIGSNVPALHALGSLLATDDPLAREIRPAMEFLSKVTYYSLDDRSIASDRAPHLR